MSPSLTLQAMKAVFRVAHQRALKAAGFERRAPHLFRLSGDLIHGLHFQASQWGSRDEGRFTVNLVVTSEPLYRLWTGRALPANPATALFPVLERIGKLMPRGRDHWWEVAASTDLERLQDEVATVLSTRALPFYSEFPDQIALLQRLRGGSGLPGITDAQTPLVHAMLAATLGLTSEAKEQVQRALDTAGDSPFEETVRLIAGRLGLTGA